MMGKASRDKGNRYERELVQDFAAFGLRSRRVPTRQHSSRKPGRAPLRNRAARDARLL